MAEKQAQHNFQVVTFTTPAWCALCGKMIWALWQGGEQCKTCSYPAHKECKSLVPLSGCPGAKKNWATEYESRTKAKVLHLYNATSSDEISLQKGEIVSLIETFPNGWSRIEKKSVIALFPTNHLEIIKSASSASQQPAVSTPVKKEQPKPVSANSTPKKPAEGWGISIGGWGTPQKTQNEKILETIAPDAEKLKKIDNAWNEMDRISKKDFEELGKIMEQYSKQVQALHETHSKLASEVSKLGEKYKANPSISSLYTQMGKDMEQGESDRIFFSNSVRNCALHFNQEAEAPLKQIRQGGLDKKMKNLNKDLDQHLKDQTAKVPINEVSPQQLIPITLTFKGIIDEINTNRDQQLELLDYHTDQLKLAPVDTLKQWLLAHIKYSKAAFSTSSEIPDQWAQKFTEVKGQAPQHNWDQFQPTEFDPSTLVVTPSKTETIENEPEYWIIYKTEEGDAYYYNQTTEETTWDRPNVPDDHIISETQE